MSLLTLARSQAVSRGLNIHRFAPAYVETPGSTESTPPSLGAFAPLRSNICVQTSKTRSNEHTAPIQEALGMHTHDPSSPEPWYHGTRRASRRGHMLAALGAVVLLAVFLVGCDLTAGGNNPGSESQLGAGATGTVV